MLVLASALSSPLSPWRGPSEPAPGQSGTAWDRPARVLHCRGSPGSRRSRVPHYYYTIIHVICYLLCHSASPLSLAGAASSSSACA